MAARSFESMVQDLVYNVDVGGGYRVIKLVLYVLVTVVIMLVFTARQFTSFTEPAAMEYAQLGRNLAREGKLVTDVVRPGTMAYLVEHTSEGDPRIFDHPDIIHPPLYPALLALGFKVSGLASYETALDALKHRPEQWIVVPLGHLFTLLTGILVWLCGRRLFDNRVGLLAMSLFFLSESVWRTSISGLALPMATCLATGAFYLALAATGPEEDEEGAGGTRMVPLVASIVLCVLAFLTQYAAAVIVPAIAMFYAVQKRPGWKWAGILLLAFVVGIAPWMIRNKAVSGGLFGYAPATVMEETRAYPGNQFDRTFAPDTGKPGDAPEKGPGLAASAKALQIKWLENVRTFYNENLRTMGEGLVVCFFIVTFFYSFVRPQTRWFRWCLALGIFLLMGFGAFFGQETLRALHMFLPFVLIYGTAFFFILLDRMKFTYQMQRIAVAVIFVLLVAAPLAVTMLPPKKGFPYPPYLAPYAAYACSVLEEDELMCTDMPWATAWYGDRTSLLLPKDVSTFYRVNDEQASVDAFLFTLLTRDQSFVSDLLTGADASWFGLQMGQLPEGFPPMEGMPIAQRDQLLLARSDILLRAKQAAEQAAAEAEAETVAGE